MADDKIIKAREESVFGQLMKPAAFTFEHEILARLIGEWDGEGEWYPSPGRAHKLTGRVVNVGILQDYFVESKTYFGDIEGSRVIYAFDHQENQFVLFAINLMTGRPDIEYGHYDAQADSLCFSFTEYVGPKRLAVIAERTISFVSPDAHDVTISYPELEPDRQLGMSYQLRRILGTAV